MITLKEVRERTVADWRRWVIDIEHAASAADPRARNAAIITAIRDHPDLDPVMVLDVLVDHLAIASDRAAEAAKDAREALGVANAQNDARHEAEDRAERMEHENRALRMQIASMEGYMKRVHEDDVVRDSHMENTSAGTHRPRDMPWFGQVPYAYPSVANGKQAEPAPESDGYAEAPVQTYGAGILRR